MSSVGHITSLLVRMPEEFITLMILLLLRMNVKKKVFIWRMSIILGITKISMNNTL